MSEPTYSSEGGWIQGLVQGANNTVVNIFHSGFQALSNVLEPVFKSFIAESVGNDPSLVKIQDQYLVASEQLRLERERLKYEISASDRHLELREQELNLKSWFFSSKLKVIQNCHDEAVKLRLQELQSNWDIQHLPFLLSREETQKQFFQRSEKFWVLLSPSKIICEIQDFRSLDVQIENRLENFVNEYYLSEQIPFPVGCRKIFKEPLEKQQAIHARELLYPVPTLTLQSTITDDEFYITITCPASIDSSYRSSFENQVTLPAWNWESIKQRLELQGKSSRDSIRHIKELIVAFHIVISLYFFDLYCLQIDPYHDLKLLRFLSESAFSEALHQWGEPYKKSLLEFRESVRQKNQQVPACDAADPQENTTDHASYSNSFVDDTGGCIAPIAGAVALAMFLGFCSQIPSGTNPSQTEQDIILPNNALSGAGRRNARGTPGIIVVPPEGVNLRGTPNGQIVGKLYDGNRIVAFESDDSNQWLRVEAQDGSSGWVWSEFVRLEN